MIIVEILEAAFMAAYHAFIGMFGAILDAIWMVAGQVLMPFMFFAYLFLGSCTQPDKPTVEEMMGLFDMQFDRFERMVATCEAHPQLFRVENERNGFEAFIGEDRILGHDWEPLGADAQPLAETVRKELEAFPAEYLTCWREGKKPEGLLTRVDITLVAEGLSVSGFSRSIFHRPEWQGDAGPLAQEVMDDWGFVPLKKAGWYIWIDER